MTGIIAGNLAITAFNIVGILIMQICMAMRVPFPHWAENFYIVGAVYVIVLVIIWYSTYKLVEG